jgi:hypothetical protein
MSLKLLIIQLQLLQFERGVLNIFVETEQEMREVRRRENREGLTDLKMYSSDCCSSVMRASMETAPVAPNK